MTLVLGPRDVAPPVLPILGLLAADTTLAEQTAERFAEPYGGIALRGPWVPFDRTDYYEPELGSGLQRRYLACGAFVEAEPAALIALKEQAWRLEQELADEGGHRRVNLDPGTLDATRVVLASFKVGPQKLYAGQRVWADLVLWFSRGAFSPLPWTFPDLRGPEHWPFFEAARGHYKGLLRAWRRELREKGDET